MINRSEVIETNRMITDSKLDVRTITLGISLLSCIDSDLKKCCDKIYDKIGDLEKAVAGLSKAKDTIKEAELIRDKVLPKMEELRTPCDEAETLTAKSYWPYPSYGDLLFGVK